MMKKELFYALVIVCIITHIVRSVYEILKHKQTIKPGKLSFLIILINMLLLWTSWVLVCKFDNFKVNFPNIIQYAGISLAGIGVIIFLISLFTIKTLESYEGDLITTGIYSIIRHPMYLGFILWLIGFPVYFHSFISLVLALPFLANILLWRYLEEKELEKRYPAYGAYKKTTLF
jgi:protein-S-isoprenylcysteine O-methyltransferase Ste14